MGIRGLSTTFKYCQNQIQDNNEYSFIENHDIPGIYNTTIDEIAAKHYASMSNSPLLIAVDFMEISHHWLSSNNTQFIVNFTHFMSYFIKNRIFPIFCFDGQPDDSKNIVLDSRREKRLNYKEQLEKLQQQKNELILMNDYNQLATINQYINKATIRSKSVNIWHFKVVKTILDSIGMPYFHIPEMEGGEMICAHLQRYGHVKYCMTNDLDVFPMGASWVIRGFNFRTKTCQLYNSQTIMRNIGITSSKEFIDLCILHGCDYIDRPYGLTNNMIVDFIKRFKSIENIKEYIDALPDTDITFPENYDPTDAREFFKTPILEEVFNWKPPSIEYWCNFINFCSQQDTVKNTINTFQIEFPNEHNFTVSCAIVNMLFNIQSLNNIA